MTAPATLEAALLGAEPQPTAPAVPWPTDFELEVRRELADIRAHQLRQDGLLMQLQLSAARADRAATQLAMRLEAKLDSLAAYLRGNGGSNG